MQEKLKKYLQSYLNANLSEGAQWAALEDGVTNFNSTYGTDHDPHTTVVWFFTRGK